MDSVGRRLISSYGPLTEALRRHRLEENAGAKVVGQLFGVTLDAASYDQGQAFVKGVLERAGEDGLGRSCRGGPSPGAADAGCRSWPPPGCGWPASSSPTTTPESGQPGGKMYNFGTSPVRPKSGVQISYICVQSCTRRRRGGRRARIPRRSSRPSSVGQLADRHGLDRDRWPGGRIGHARRRGRRPTRPPRARPGHEHRGGRPASVAGGEDVADQQRGAGMSVGMSAPATHASWKMDSKRANSRLRSRSNVSRCTMASNAVLARLAPKATTPASTRAAGQRCKPPAKETVMAVAPISTAVPRPARRLAAPVAVEAGGEQGTAEVAADTGRSPTQPVPDERGAVAAEGEYDQGGEEAGDPAHPGHGDLGQAGASGHVGTAGRPQPGQEVDQRPADGVRAARPATRRTTIPRAATRRAPTRPAPTSWAPTSRGRRRVGAGRRPGRRRRGRQGGAGKGHRVDHAAALDRLDPPATHDVRAPHDAVDAVDPPSRQRRSRRRPRQRRRLDRVAQQVKTQPGAGGEHQHVEIEERSGEPEQFVHRPPDAHGDRRDHRGAEGQAGVGPDQVVLPVHHPGHERGLGYGMGLRAHQAQKGGGKQQQAVDPTGHHQAGGHAADGGQEDDEPAAAPHPVDGRPDEAWTDDGERSSTVHTRPRAVRPRAGAAATR